MRSFIVIKKAWLLFLFPLFFCYLSFDILFCVINFEGQADIWGSKSLFSCTRTEQPKQFICTLQSVADAVSHLCHLNSLSPCEACLPADVTSARTRAETVQRAAHSHTHNKDFCYDVGLFSSGGNVFLCVLTESSLKY